MKPITPENLKAAGWRLLGGGWYSENGNKRLTNFEGKFQIWINGASKEVFFMNEI